jgi:hypothetical protein
VTSNIQPQDASNTRLTRGSYIADIFLDQRNTPHIFHWIVQKVGSAAILHWGQEYTFESAHQAATSYLEERSRRDAQKPA